MSRISRTTLAALCGLAMPVAAFAAVEPGTYSSQDGVYGFTVIADPNNAGQYLLNGFHWGFTDTCPNGSTISGGFGAGYGAGQGQQIAASGKVVVLDEGATFYMSDTVTFKGNTATAKILTVDPAFVLPSGGKKPTKAMTCSAKPISFTATLMTSAVTPTLARGTVPMGAFTYRPAQ